MSADKLLALLDGVRQTGDGRWLARCPAHGDKSPSLSVRELPDGRVLLHCFAQCATAAVLDALNLDMSDLFPERRGDHFQPNKSRIPAGDVLQALAHEVDAAAILLAQIADRREITEDEWQRVALCARRIGAATHGR